MHRVFSLCVVVLFVVSAAHAQVWTEDGASGGPVVRCQILDNPDKPIYDISVCHIPEARIGSYGDSSVVEIEIDWYFAQLMDIGYGDIDLNMVLDLTLWGHSAGIQMPDQLLEFALVAGWTWRYDSGMGFQVRTMPGVYSDMEEFSSEMFYMPWSFAVVHAFDPSLSGIIGAQIRPSFNRVVLPLIGAEWQVNDAWRVKVQVPESRVTWYAAPDWSVYLGLDWQDTTYSLREKGTFDREELTLEDWRVYVGSTYRLTDQIELSADIGSVFDRNIEFEDDSDSFDGEIDISSEMFLRFGIIGPF